MTMENRFDDEQCWTEVGNCITHLTELLKQIPEDSLHSLQAATLLTKTQSLKETWQSLGESRRAGRPRGRFLLHDDEKQFTDCMAKMIEECFDPDKNNMKVGQKVVKCHVFFAWIYDAAVLLGISSGNNDLKAYYNLIIGAVKQTKHAEKFIMAMNTLNNYVKNWEKYTIGYSSERILLHKISQENTVSREYRRRLAFERAEQQYVVELARQYNLLPAAAGQ